MVKYTDDFKAMVVREYLEGTIGYERLAKKHGVKSNRQVRDWVNAYKKFGMEGLVRKKRDAIYSVQFKLDVLNFMKRTGASLADTALHFGLTNTPMVAVWKKKFLNGGAEALDNPKGRPVMSDKAKNVKKNQKPTQENEMTREQKLERENELLRLEVEYLKKLRAFQMDPDGYLEKHKQRYHSNSKKNSH
ncbi:helix-turn-helix domain-containing protein [Sporosarcina thermotolerans]|uniref:Helix-turn-helix domain-containing protein n=1 Tax=Sporosarcina thermotolerans TaxID=633404 RepID=A0AAW9AAM1_9BACL|nr:helix-turn-helix domain-containing protein [Sporosarcina thermotolerans]MDW0116231.1 helix-turn-helix domain-containing protein [Sporosarcina thermotolerans]WHT48203.1 helix-turn-helix domain-containing protein [Sporosarcina thermotolerans]